MLSRKRIVFMLIILTIFVSCATLIINRNQQEDKLSSVETKALANLVNEYYGSLEENNYEKTLSYVYLSKNIDGENFISHEERKKVLESIMKSYYTKFELGTKCNNERIYFDKQENMVATYVDIIVEERSGKKKSINEVLFFKKLDDEWKIFKIEASEDVLLPYRTYRFEIK